MPRYCLTAWSASHVFHVLPAVTSWLSDVSEANFDGSVQFYMAYMLREGMKYSNTTVGYHVEKARLTLRALFSKPNGQPSPLPSTYGASLTTCMNLFCRAQTAGPVALARSIEDYSRLYNNTVTVLSPGTVFPYNWLMVRG